MIKDTYRITTLGCKVNKAESIEIERQFSGRGYRTANGDEIPEYWIVNTCAVTAVGMQKSRKAVRKCMRTGARVIVTGCGVDFNRSEFESMGLQDLVSNHDKESIVDSICGSCAKKDCRPEILRIENRRIPIKIQDGCSRSCSYCIVPKLRERPWCMKKETVIEKVKLYKNIGAGEIILCGIDLGGYRGQAEDEDLKDLVESLMDEVPGIWIRLSSIGLKDITEALVALLEREKGLCSHLHISLQSGDDRVLESMDRGYSRNDYLEKVQSIRQRVPDIAITTDVMVGYPAEDEKAFLNTVDAVREAGFSKVHVFRYSPRPDTKAFELGDPVSGDEKKRRSLVIADEARKQAEAYHSGFRGKTVEVLVEKASGGEEGELIGRTQWYSEVRFRGSPGLAGKKAAVFIEGIKGTVLSGVIKSEF